jgi:hypothetical protein
MRTKLVFKSLPVSVRTAMDRHQVLVAGTADQSAPHLQRSAAIGRSGTSPSVIWGME